MPKDLGLRFVSSSDIRVFNIDWSPFLNRISATIANSVWIVPVSLTDLVESNTTLKTSIKLSGWAPATSYTIVNTVSTTTGETRSVEFVVECAS